MNKSTTTIRIYKDSHKKLSSFLQANGLKSVRAVSTVLTRVIAVDFQDIAAILRAGINPNIDPNEIVRSISIKTAAKILEFSDRKSFLAHQCLQRQLHNQQSNLFQQLANAL